jgi:asparagine synthase (glutamine-hydrolysing)
MCGIAGLIAGPGASPDRAVLTRMTRALAHRGPDAEGIVIEGAVGLGHRRLSVLDLSTAANQPMRDATGRFVLVFNGEIYNFREVRKDLEALGNAFATNGDTEVVLAALKQWGPKALERMIGMFAIALWDSERQSLFLARDRLGKKPLFFGRLPGGGFAFASEPRAVAAHPEVSGQVDEVALAHYLRLNYVPCNRTLFRGVESLPPACYAWFDVARGLRVERYWDLAAKFREKRAFVSEEAAAEELRALIDDAVRLRLVSDVPLGAFLSGGVDSSTIVAAMTQAVSADRIFTFSSGFLEDSYDESPLAEQLAREFGLVHRTQSLDTRSLDIVPAVIAAAAEPIADTSMLPMYFLSKFTRDSVTVALSGDGGDECFAGYETYVADKVHGLARHSPGWVRRQLPAFLDRVLPVDHRKVGWPEKLRRFSAALPLDSARAHAAWRDIFGESEVSRVMRKEWRAEGAGDPDVFADYFAGHFADVEGCHPVDQASYVDIKTWLVDDILVKADRMSMAHSLEVRCPLLDHRVVEFAAQLPPEFKLRGFAKKHLLKQSQRSRLPAWVLDRPKRGFNAPVSQWLLGPLRELCEDTLFSGSMRQWFDQTAMQQLWSDHERKRRDNGLKLFGLLTVGLFVQRASASDA